ncbi:MAG: zinc-binding dehydrogenase [Halobacteriales archaeon]|nr:zinc-binding dehydrogenase [Halobacteriales archaeon]
MTDRGTVMYLAAPKEIEAREYDVPEAGPGGILTEIERANVCGSELHMWRGDHPEVDEGVLGHEAVARVRDLGEGVDTDFAGEPIEPGDLIAPAYFITCRRCDACQAGDFNLCENAYVHWTQSPDEYPHFRGTWATHYYIHPDQYFYKVPDGVDANVAASANCALSQVLYGIDEAGISYGDSVVIQGAGGLGLNAIAVANERGAETIVIEGTDHRIESAHAFDADHVIDFREYDSVEARADRVAELTDGTGADAAIEVAGVPDAFAEGIHHVRKGGEYLEMGNVTPGHTTAFDPGLLTRKAIDITAAIRYDPWYLRKALTFLDDHQDSYPYDGLVDAEYPLSAADAALEASDAREINRATLVPE